MRGLDYIVAFRLSLVETPAWRAPHHGGLQQDLPDGQITRLPVQPPLQKYFRFRCTQIKSISLAVPGYDDLLCEADVDRYRARRGQRKRLSIA